MAAVTMKSPLRPRHATQAAQKPALPQESEPNAARAPTVAAAVCNVVVAPSAAEAAAYIAVVAAAVVVAEPPARAEPAVAPVSAVVPASDLLPAFVSARVAKESASPQAHFLLQRFRQFHSPVRSHAPA